MNETRIPQPGEAYPPGSDNIIEWVRPVPGERECVVDIHVRTPTGSSTLQHVDYCYLSQFSGAFSGDEQNAQTEQALQDAGVVIRDGKYVFPDGSPTRAGALHDPLRNTAYYLFIAALERINPGHFLVANARGAMDSLRYREANWDAYFAAIDAAIANSHGEHRTDLERQRADYLQRRLSGAELKDDYTQGAPDFGANGPEPMQRYETGVELVGAGYRPVLLEGGTDPLTATVGCAKCSLTGAGFAQPSSPYAPEPATTPAPAAAPQAGVTAAGEPAAQLSISWLGLLLLGLVLGGLWYFSNLRPS